MRSAVMFLFSSLLILGCATDDDPDVTAENDSVIATPWGTFSATARIPRGAPIKVHSCGALESALNEAQKGDDIVIEAAELACGALVIDKHGTSDQPIVIRGALATAQGKLVMPELHGALAITGDHVIVAGISFVGPTACVDVSGSFDRILRNSFTGWSCGEAIHVAGAGRQGSEIAFNVLHDPVWPKRAFQPPSGSDGPNIMGLRTGDEDHFQTRVYVHHNYFHDFPQKPGCFVADRTSPRNYHCGQDDAMEIGNDAATGAVLAKWLIADNLIEHHREGNGILDLKVSKVMVRRNTIVDCPGGRIDFRQSNDSVLAGNWIEDAGGSDLFGADHVAIGNVFTNATLHVRPGSREGLGEGHPVAVRTQVIANRGPIDIGKGYAGDHVEARKTCTERNAHAPALGPLQTGSHVGCASPIVAPLAVRLRPADVGPDGALAPDLE